MGGIKIGAICKLDNSKMNKLVKDTVSILSGERKVKPKIINSLYFMSMKSIIKNNSNYFFI